MITAAALQSACCHPQTVTGLGCLMTTIWDLCTFWRALGGICQPNLQSTFAEHEAVPCHILGREARDHQSKPHLTCLPTGLELSVP